MMNNLFLFVGEKPSNLAIRKGWEWKDGRLAAKQLFDALEFCGINPVQQSFANWFDGEQNVVRKYKGTIVAMGRKVERALIKENIPHLFIYHPATRGTVRRKELYCNHVKNALL
jgi:hypothetical protein